MRLPGTRCARAASAPCGRVPTTATVSESERTPAATVERLLIVLSVAERSPPRPGRPSGHRRPVRERRAAHARCRNPAARYQRPARGAMVVLKRGSRRPVEPGARRPDHLAVYMGCCAYRGKGRLSRGECARIGKRALRRAPAGACRGRRRRKRGVSRAWGLGRLLLLVQPSTPRDAPPCCWSCLQRDSGRRVACCSRALSRSVRVSSGPDGRLSPRSLESPSSRPPGDGRSEPG